MEKGVEVSEEKMYGYKVTTVRIQTEQAAKELEKEIGSYITIEADESLGVHIMIEGIGECLAEVLGRVMQPYYHSKLCICGVGHRDLPADALGPKVLQNLPLSLLSELGTEENFREVCSIEPGTASTNNINTEVIVSGVVQAVGADCLLLVDSLATNEPSKLFRTIQLSTAGGLSPYLSGRKVDWSALGVPLISLGVPMAIPLAALAPQQDLNDDMLTGTHVQDVIESAGRIIAYAILRICWPSKSKAECFGLSGINCTPLPYSFLTEDE